MLEAKYATDLLTYDMETEFVGKFLVPVGILFSFQFLFGEGQKDLESSSLPQQSMDIAAGL